MKKEIMQWLQSPREFNAGVALYAKYGYNKHLKKVFELGETKNSRESLEYELAKIVGITVEELNRLPRFANVEKPIEVIKFTPTSTAGTDIDDLLISLGTQFGLSVDELFSPGIAMPESATDDQKKVLIALAPKYAEIPETQKKIIRFREQFPFLKEADCPDVLKVMVANMFAAYDKYREAYAELSPESPEIDNLAAAKDVVESYLDNRAMWAELEYYKENKKILGEHPMFEDLKLAEEVKATPDIELNKKLGNARSNVTKNRNKLAAATDEDQKAEYQALLDKWLKIEAAYHEEMNIRKKA